MKKVIISILALAPAFAFAQLSTFQQNIITPLGNIVTAAIPIVFGILVLAFFWGLVKFVFAAGNEESKASGKNIMIWGLVAMFIAASVWGLVLFIRSNLGIGSDTSVTVPTVR